MEEKKPNVTVPNYVHDVLMRDIEIFRTNKNELCNTIFGVLKDEFQQIADGQKNKSIRFNLHKKNIFDFDEFIRGRNESNSEMLSGIFTTYVNMPQYKRELVLNILIRPYWNTY